MRIVSMEVKFSKIGMTRINQPRQVCYMPVAVIQFEGGSKKKRIYLQGVISNKKSVKQVFAGETFIALLIDDDFRIYDIDGNISGQVSANDYGQLIQVNEDSFVLLKDRTATWISDKGEVIKSRELTEEEFGYLNER